MPAIRPIGIAIAALALGGLSLPFVAVRANRIAAGDGRLLWQALPLEWAALVIAVLVVCTGLSLWRPKGGPLSIAAMAGVTVAIVALALGAAGTHNTPSGDTLVRVAPGAGFWLLLAAGATALADALVRLKLRPLGRLTALAIVLGAIGLLLGSGWLGHVSVLREYAGRAEQFWQQAGVHVVLSFGALGAAVLVGVPLGVLIQRIPRLRAGTLGLLNAVQTIPSIALFGLLIAPLAWLAATLPGLKAVGIGGIGPAPAFIALFLYGLMPIVSTVIAAIDGVPRSVVDAARGLGMTRMQRLFAVEAPLGLPVVLTGIRVVLVQNIGMATVAALIGGGGFGTFVFQGVGQAAMDLVLLGVAPTVLLATASGIVLDALIDLAGARR